MLRRGLCGGMGLGRIMVFIPGVMLDYSGHPGCYSSKLITGNKLITDGCCYREREWNRAFRASLPAADTSATASPSFAFSTSKGQYFPASSSVLLCLKNTFYLVSCCLVSPRYLNLFKWIFFFTPGFQNFYLMDSAFPFLKARFLIILSLRDGQARYPPSWNCLYSKSIIQKEMFMFLMSLN